MIPYTVRRYRKSKCVRISIRPQGVLVTAPKWVTQREIRSFVEKRSGWIAQHISQTRHITRSPMEMNQLRERTRDRVWEMLDRVNQMYRYDFQRVFIRDVISRWGSCSASGNLNFSVRAGLLSDHLLEYLVTHEICHLKEMNHSARFWSLVARTIPDYLNRRRELRDWEEPIR